MIGAGESIKEGRSFAANNSAMKLFKSRREEGGRGRGGKIHFLGIFQAHKLDKLRLADFAWGRENGRRGDTSATAATAASTQIKWADTNTHTHTQTIQQSTRSLSVNIPAIFFRFIHFLV